MRDFQERDTRPDPKDELRDRLKAEDDSYKDAHCILKAAGLQDEYWPEDWAKLEKERKSKGLSKIPFTETIAKLVEIQKACQEEDEFRAFKFLTDNGLTITGLQPLDFYAKHGKLTQRMKDYKNERTSGDSK